MKLRGFVYVLRVTCWRSSWIQINLRSMCVNQCFYLQFADFLWKKMDVFSEKWSPEFAIPYTVWIVYTATHLLLELTV